MVDVFISYARAERAKIKPIHAELEALGLKCFFDARDIDDGAQFPDVIDRAVKSAKAVLACWSPLALTRAWVLQECRVAKARGVLIPVALESFEELAVPVDFFGTQYIALPNWQPFASGPAGAGWYRILSALEKLTDQPLNDRSLARLLADARKKPHPPRPPMTDIERELMGTWYNPDGSKMMLEQQIEMRERTGLGRKPDGSNPALDTLKARLHRRSRLTPEMIKSLNELERDIEALAKDTSKN